MLSLRKKSTRRENARRKTPSDRDEHHREGNKGPADHGGPCLFLLRANLARSKDNKQPEYQVKNREEREQRDQSSNDIVEYRQQPQMLFRLRHSDHPSNRQL